MLNYIARRILIMIPTLFVISLLVYVIIDLPPGDCVTSQIDELISRGDPDALNRAEELRHLYGLDQSLIARYFTWVGGVFRWDFGLSCQDTVPVKDLIGVTPWNLYSFSFLVAIAGLSHVPHVYLVVATALHRLGSDFEEAASLAGAKPRSVALNVSFPMVMPAILFAGALVFFLGFQLFGLPLVLGDPQGILVLSTYLFKLPNKLGVPSESVMAVVAVVRKVVPKELAWKALDANGLFCLAVLSILVLWIYLINNPAPPPEPSQIDEVGLDRVVAQLTPEQRRELQRLLQKTSAQAD